MKFPFRAWAYLSTILMVKTSTVITVNRLHLVYMVKFEENYSSLLAKSLILVVQPELNRLTRLRNK